MRPTRRLIAALLLAAGTALAAEQAPSICGTPEARSFAHRGFLYGAMPTLYGQPPLRALTARLDSLKALGVRAIWLPPVFQTDDPSAISYSVTDYRRLRPDFGTGADLRALVHEAHMRGMRVLLDFVPNHTSDHHPWFVDAQKNGPRSPTYDFYARDAHGAPTHYFDWQHLENLDYRNPALRERMISAFTYWVRAFDVDGFRLDAAWGVTARAPDFWPKLRAALDHVKPHLFLLAEASARDPYYAGHGLDAAYDWTADLGHWAWQAAFDDPGHAGELLSVAIASTAIPMHEVARFLDNNDTGKRFVTRHGIPTTRVAAVMLATLPGVPLLYSGEETGAEFEPYEDPAPLSDADPHGLRPLYQRLAKLHEALPVLGCGGYRPIATGAPGVLAYAREARGLRSAVVVLNYAAPARVKLEPGAYTDALTGRRVVVSSEGLELAASSALVLTRSPAGPLASALGRGAPAPPG